MADVCDRGHRTCRHTNEGTVMAGKAAEKDKAPQAGLTPEPGGEDTRVPDTATATPAEPSDRQYVILVAQQVLDHVTSWSELGTVTASTRPEAWDIAKSRWGDQLVPAVPGSPAEAQAQEPVLAKVIPARNFVTVESRVEYVAPRAVAKGI